jgi:hypothetical protein
MRDTHEKEPLMDDFINLVATLTPIAILIGLDLFRENGNLNRLLCPKKRPDDLV